MKIFYTCKQAHQVISEGLDNQLNLSQKTHLAIHLGLCRSCANFKKQMQTLRLAMQQLSDYKDKNNDANNSISDKK